MVDKGKTKTSIPLHSGRLRISSAAALSMTCASDSSGTITMRLVGRSSAHSLALPASRSQTSSIGKAANQCGEKLVRTILNRIHAPLHKPYVSGKPRSTRRSKEREIEAREGVSRILWSTIPLLAGVVAREERVNGLNGLTLVRSGGFNLKGRPKARAKNQYADHASGVCHLSSQSADNARPEPRGNLGDSSRSAQMNTLFPWNSNNSGPHPN